MKKWFFGIWGGACLCGTGLGANFSPFYNMTTTEVNINMEFTVCGDCNCENELPRNSSSKRWPFTPGENARLAEMVQKYGLKGKWNLIASFLPGRTGRQCRDRYVNYLAPGVKKRPWTEEEDERLLRYVELCGTHWSVIAPNFPGRSQNALKNEWNKLNKGQSETCGFKARVREHIEGNAVEKKTLFPVKVVRHEAPSKTPCTSKTDSNANFPANVSKTEDPMQWDGNPLSLLSRTPSFLKEVNF